MWYHWEAVLFGVKRQRFLSWFQRLLRNGSGQMISAVRGPTGPYEMSCEELGLTKNIWPQWPNNYEWPHWIGSTIFQRLPYILTLLLTKKQENFFFSIWPSFSFLALKHLQKKYWKSQLFSFFCKGLFLFQSFLHNFMFPKHCFYTSYGVSSCKTIFWIFNAYRFASNFI